jgi:hypothetical protein
MIKVHQPSQNCIDEHHLLLHLMFESFQNTALASFSALSIKHIRQQKPYIETTRKVVHPRKIL